MDICLFLLCTNYHNKLYTTLRAVLSSQVSIRPPQQRGLPPTEKGNCEYSKTASVNRDLRPLVDNPLKPISPQHLGTASWPWKSGEHSNRRQILEYPVERRKGIRYRMNASVMFSLEWARKRALPRRRRHTRYEFGWRICLTATCPLRMLWSRWRFFFPCLLMVHLKAADES